MAENKNVIKLFERLSERSRFIYHFATLKQKKPIHPNVNCLHILLALIEVEDGLGAKRLKDMGVDMGKLREVVISELGRHFEKDPDLDFNPRVISAFRQADRIVQASQIDPEHILLGMILHGANEAAKILKQFSIYPTHIQDAVFALKNKMAEESLIEDALDPLKSDEEKEHAMFLLCRCIRDTMQSMNGSIYGTSIRHMRKIIAYLNSSILPYRKDLDVVVVDVATRVPDLEVIRQSATFLMKSHEGMNHLRRFRSLMEQSKLGSREDYQFGAVVQAMLLGDRVERAVDYFSRWNDIVHRVEAESRLSED